MRFPKARVEGTSNELIDRRTVAISGVKLPEGIHRQPKRVDLPKGMGLYPRSVQANTIRVAGVHEQFRPISTSESGIVVETMGCVKPSI